MDNQTAKAVKNNLEQCINLINVGIGMSLPKTVPPEQKPKFKVGDVCWWDGSLPEEVSNIKHHIVKKDGDIVCLKSAPASIFDWKISPDYFINEASLTLIPQPKSYTGLKPGDTFEQDGKQYRITGTGLPKDGQNYIDYYGSILVSDGDYTNSNQLDGVCPIRFIVEEVKPEAELKDGWWYWVKDGTGETLLKCDIGLWLSKDFGISTKDIKPTALSNLAVEIDGVKCWFVKGCNNSGDKYIRIEFSTGGHVIGYKLKCNHGLTYKAFQELAKLLSVPVICEAQWDALRGGEVI